MKPRAVVYALGVRLKKEDIETAHVAARHSGFIADEVAPFLDTLRRQGFTRLNVMHLFRACAFVAHPDGNLQIPSTTISASPCHRGNCLAPKIGLENTENTLIDGISQVTDGLGPVARRERLGGLRGFYYREAA